MAINIAQYKEGLPNPSQELKPVFNPPQNVEWDFKPSPLDPLPNIPDSEFQESQISEFKLDPLQILDFPDLDIPEFQIPEFDSLKIPEFKPLKIPEFDTLQIPDVSFDSAQIIDSDVIHKMKGYVTGWKRFFGKFLQCKDRTFCNKNDD